MYTTIFSFAVSLIMIIIILHTNNVHAKLTMDYDTTGIQKYHTIIVPRIGGLAIFCGVLMTALFAANIKVSWESYIAGLTVASFVVFIGGLAEDLSKNFTALQRIIFMTVGTFIAIFSVHITSPLNVIGIPIIDMYLKHYELLSLSLSIILIVGVTNAYNLIDGYNGLSSSFAIINLLAITYIAYMVNDNDIFYSSLSIIGASTAFIAFNYPRGKIFLGDGGAYFLGFSIACMSLYLSQKYSQQVSPFVFLLFTIYPITEVLFSIYRRKIVRKVSSIKPDNLHLHQLIYHRLISHHAINKRNHKVTPIILLLFTPSIIWGCFVYNNLLLILLGILFYPIAYIYLYRQIIKFKTSNLLLWLFK